MLGDKLRAIRQRAIDQGLTLLNEDQIAAEVAERRGGGIMSIKDLTDYHLAVEDLVQEQREQIATLQAQLKDQEAKYSKLWDDCGSLNDRNHELLQALQGMEAEIKRLKEGEMKCNESYRKYEEDQMPRARCLECGKICTPKRVDYGVGRIEVHGHKTTHHDWQWESDCCEAPCEDA